MIQQLHGDWLEFGKSLVWLTPGTTISKIDDIAVSILKLTFPSDGIERNYILESFDVPLARDARYEELKKRLIPRLYILPQWEGIANQVDIK